ncbi:MAG: hypothetical protein KF720_04245 [Rubrivivax sp.]|nr:hypothetical protein [Rubrivivax sp.]
MAIGQELLDVPIADMVRDLAGAVAEGQLALDRASIDTLKFLADQANAIDLIPEVVEVIAPNNSNVVVNGQNVAVAGVSVTQQPTTPVKTTLLQAGLLPTFYQFTEALIEVKLSVTLKEAGTVQTSTRPGFSKRSIMAFAAPVNFRNASTYTHTAEGSSLLRVTMKPVPAPVRLAPDVVTVNALVNPPVVTRTER